MGGAFDGIEEIVKQRLGEKVIGFGQNNKAMTKIVLTCKKSSQKDIQKFGIIPELIGTLACLCSLGAVDCG